MQPSEEWPSWSSELCSQNGWKHRSGSPLVWRELVDRGGKGLYLGGLTEFEHYAQHYYHIVPDTSRELEEAIAKENMDTFSSLKLEQENAPKVHPVRVCVTNASSLLAYQLLLQLATGKVFGEKKAISIHLYDHNDENQDQLEGVALELFDLASPILHEVRVTRTVREAVDSVSMAFILDYPYLTQTSRDEEIQQNDEVEMAPSTEVKGDSKEAKEEVEEKKDVSSSEIEKEGSFTLPVIAEEATPPAKAEPDVIQEETAESALSPPPQPLNPAPTQCADVGAVAELYHRYAATMDFCSEKDVRVIVCGRYANTGAAVMSRAVSSIDKANFIASPCLAEQQAKAIVARHLSLNGADISHLAVWGSTCGAAVLPDLANVRVKHFPGAVVGPDPYDLPITRCVFDTDWLDKEFATLFQSRHRNMEGYRESEMGGGAALVEAIGLVSLTKEWWEGTSDSWRSVGVASHSDTGGVYGIPVGVVFSQPACLSEGRWIPVQDLEVTQKIKVELLKYND